MKGTSVIGIWREFDKWVINFNRKIEVKNKVRLCMDQKEQGGDEGCKRKKNRNGNEKKEIGSSGEYVKKGPGRLKEKMKELC